jgi:hypothetical protein
VKAVENAENFREYVKKYREYRERAREALRKYWHGSDSCSFGLAFDGAGEMADLLDEMFDFAPEELEYDGE